MSGYTDEDVIHNYRNWDVEINGQPTRFDRFTTISSARGVQIQGIIRGQRAVDFFDDNPAEMRHFGFSLGQETNIAILGQKNLQGNPPAPPAPPTPQPDMASLVSALMAVLTRSPKTKKRTPSKTSVKKRKTP